mmetsp:Transcript_43898/g.140690  ORF Transcript_43898/g.140690 Transcript_43898/m.140690 type:complete len:662 (-) Transcript_43898:125-2110(-)
MAGARAEQAECLICQDVCGGVRPADVALVGAPVQVIDKVRPRGCVQGEHGCMEFTRPGDKSHFYWGFCLLNGAKLDGFVCTCLQYPLSSIVFGLIALGQELAPCCRPICGNACCVDASQMPYIKAMFVFWNTLMHSWLGYVFGLRWLLSPQPTVLFVTHLLCTPPKFVFDEEKDTPYLVPFEEYATKKAKTAPAFSGRYRAVDGGGNRRKYTWLGQGGRGYAMNEPYMVLSVLPDPDEMQKDLQFRTTFHGSPFGHNAIATWFANVAIHDFFRSASGKDKKYTGGVEKPWVNLHSGYLDLQPLYGFNEEIAKSIRSWQDGKIEKFAEDRFDANKMVESKAIVELLRREHNFICDELRKRYPYQFTTDEQLYQQARLIMGGVYINIILREYGDQMFGENAPDGRGFAEIRHNSPGYWPSASGDHQTVGNQPTFNFNLIYRWHTAIPQFWDAENLPPMETDEDLRNIFINTLKTEAGGFGPNNMPQALWTRYVSVPAAAVRQGRRLGAPRLNDFRRRFHPAYKSFEEMCGDPEVAARLAKYYPTVEDVELSVGCQVEHCSRGGWALGHTTSIAILADAFNSIRQDRFYTDDFTSEFYTPWGLEHAKTTVLADVLNRHLNLGLDRNMNLARLPDWAGPPAWSKIQGLPFLHGKCYDARGNPKLR